SRRRHTRSLRDWSSDVCSSDLLLALAWSTSYVAVLRLPLPSVAAMTTVVVPLGAGTDPRKPLVKSTVTGLPWMVTDAGSLTVPRSEERRVGKECRAERAVDS